MIPGTSLNAVNANGPGSAIDFDEVCSTVTVIASCAGSPTAGNVHLDGSHDGVNWFTLGGTTSFDGAGTSMSFTSSGPLVRYARAVLFNLTGGSSPSVTATIAAK